MPSLVCLDDVSFGDAEVDAAFRKWREAIEQANNWQVFGAAQFEPGPTGYTLHVGSGGKAVTSVASTGGIPGQALTDMLKCLVDNAPQCRGCILMRLQLAVGPACFE